MKKSFLGVVSAIVSLISMSAFSALGAAAAPAVSGAYVCSSGGGGEVSTAQALNALKCDNEKPFTVSISGNGYIIVCCVQK